MQVKLGAHADTVSCLARMFMDPLQRPDSPISFFFTMGEADLYKA